MGQWTLQPMSGQLAPAPRGAHASVAVGTKVLIFGGADRTPLAFNDLWVLETANNAFEWTRISPTVEAGCSLPPRSAATLTLIDGLVYLFGGQEPVSGVCFNDIKVLDPNTWHWREAEVHGMSPPPRHSHCAGCLAGSCLVIYGGAGMQGGALSDVWIYNPAQGAWTQPKISGTPPPGREMHSGTMIDDSRMLVFGGRGAEYKIFCDAAILDARETRWLAVEPTPFSRCAHSAVLLTLSPSQPPSQPASQPSTTTAADSQPSEATSQPTPAAAVANGHDKVAAGNGSGSSGGEEQHQQPSASAPPMETVGGASVAASEAAGASGRGQEEENGEAARSAAAAATATDASGAVPSPSPRSGGAAAAAGSSAVFIYGGYSGESAEGDVLKIDTRTLEIELLRRGPRGVDKSGSVPAVRFAHSAVTVPAPPVAAAAAGTTAGTTAWGQCMLVFGGVNPQEDLNDIALWS